MTRRLAIASTVAAALAAGVLLTPTASAGTAWSVSVGVPGLAVTAGAPGYYGGYAPYRRPYYRPYYGAYAPAPVAYVAPPVAYVEPYAYAAPVVVRAAPYRYGYGYRHGYRRY